MFIFVECLLWLGIRVVICVGVLCQVIYNFKVFLCILVKSRCRVWQRDRVFECSYKGYFFRRMFLYVEIQNLVREVDLSLVFCYFVLLVGYFGGIDILVVLSFCNVEGIRLRGRVRVEIQFLFGWLGFEFYVSLEGLFLCSKYKSVLCVSIFGFMLCYFLMIL